MSSGLHRLGSGPIRKLTTVVLSSAVGAIVAVVVPIGVAGATTSTPTGIELPLALNAGPVPNAVATDVSCASAGSCSAVGTYQDTIGIAHAMAFTLSAGTWTSQQILAPVNAPDYTFSDLNAISCFGVGNCVAVGDYKISTIQTESFYAVETSGAWARGLELPVPADAGSSPALTSFQSVSCVVGGSCQMVGVYLTSGNEVHSVVDTFSGGTLSGSPKEFSPVGSNLGIELGAISCSTATTCVAVGAQAGQSAENATYVEDNAGVWGNGVIVANPKDPSNPAEYLASVSCVAPGDCLAAGNWVDKNGNGFSETFTESGGSWGHAIDIPVSSKFNNPFADSVSCVSSVKSCTVVGGVSDNGGALHAATAQMTNGKWGQFALTGVPFGAITDHELLGVSCTSGVQCTAVGYYNTSGATGGTEAMGATWVTGLPPGTVTGLHGTEVNSHTAHLNWYSPVNIGVGVSHFEITATLVGGATVDEGPIVGLMATVTKLAPGGTYHLGVTTVADDGQTSATAMVTVRIPATKPSAPRITSVTGIPRGLRASWSPPASTGGASISGYKVTMNCGGAVHTVHFSGSARHGSIRGLPAGSTCVVRVYATNRAGVGPSSRPATGRPPA